MNLLFPHQLFEAQPLLRQGEPIVLVEEHLFFREFRFHRQKLAYHRASMRHYAAWLEGRGVEVRYISATDPLSDVRELIPALAQDGIVQIRCIEPSDDWLERRIRQAASAAGMQVEWLPSPLFLNTGEDLQPFFGAPKKSYFHHDFYTAQRKRHGILLDPAGKPLGGQWSFDADNRKPWPKGKRPPSVEPVQSDAHWQEAVAYVQTHFPDNPGELGDAPLYPYTFSGARRWLADFLQHRFSEFGPYEDAIVRGETILCHSVLTPMLNTGLLTPQTILQEAIDHGAREGIPMASLEGFVRQVIGWREFIRGMYAFHGRAERTKNFWGFSRKIPASFYDGTTGIPPVDDSIRKVLRTGYCHHIERLMVLGNFMLLCEFDPDEVYRWFMELFIDAYDWVMVPNVYGMSQFADGGLMATKPYLSGSAYVLKMSDHAKGPWQETWDGLFWRFMHVHRDFFGQNPRLGMLLGTWDRMPEEKRRKHLEAAEGWLGRLDGSL